MQRIRDQFPTFIRSGKKIRLKNSAFWNYITKKVYKAHTLPCPFSRKQCFMPAFSEVSRPLIMQLTHQMVDDCEFYKIILLPMFSSFIKIISHPNDISQILHAKQTIIMTKFCSCHAVYSIHMLVSHVQTRDSTVTRVAVIYLYIWKTVA